MLRDIRLMSSMLTRSGAGRDERRARIVSVVGPHTSRVSQTVLYVVIDSIGHLERQRKARIIRTLVRPLVPYRECHGEHSIDMDIGKIVKPSELRSSES